MGEHAENGVQGEARTQPVEQQQPPPAQAMTVIRFEPETATEAWNLARYYGSSKLIPPSLRQTADIFVTIMAGRDFGWSPMQAMRGIHVVEGKPCLSADAMVAIAKKSGACKYFRLVKSDDKEAVYETHREGDPEPVRMGFTVGEAEVAGLLARKGPWQTYRRRMLRNRAKSILCKEVYEDIFFGVWEEGEAHEVQEIRAAEPQKPAAMVPPDRSTPPAGRVTVEAKSTKGCTKFKECTLGDGHEGRCFSSRIAAMEMGNVGGRQLDSLEAAKKAKAELMAIAEHAVKVLTPEEQEEIRAIYQAACDLIAGVEKKLSGGKP